MTSLRPSTPHPLGPPGKKVAHQLVTRCVAELALGLGVLFSVSAASADPSPLDPEIGHNYAELETPRMTALGGVMRASSNSLSALYSNPANMAIAKVYHVGAYAQIQPEARRQTYGGAIVDSLISSTGLAGGLGGSWTMQDRDGIDRQWMDIRFGLAMPLGDVIYLGLGGRYITLQQNGVGVLGQSYASGGIRGSNIIQTVTIDAGLTVRATPELKFAITGNNLTSLDTALFPLLAGLGASYDTEDFSVGADLTMETRTYDKVMLRARAGGEILFADQVMVRLGYRFDQGPDSHALCGGLGYVNKLFSIDASVRRSVVGPSYTAITFGISGHIESMSLGASSPDQ
ncbi:MAG TPA: hypothetical protein VN764_01175 [Polyangiaceae bacterium]|nr:hypothetical protein [Polyangiaceae bacterium]